MKLGSVCLVSQGSELTLKQHTHAHTHSLTLSPDVTTITNKHPMVFSVIWPLLTPTSFKSSKIYKNHCISNIHFVCCFEEYEGLETLAIAARSLPILPLAILVQERGSVFKHSFRAEQLSQQVPRNDSG